MRTSANFQRDVQASANERKYNEKSTDDDKGEREHRSSNAKKTSPYGDKREASKQDNSPKINSETSTLTTEIRFETALALIKMISSPTDTDAPVGGTTRL